MEGRTGAEKKGGMGRGGEIEEGRRNGGRQGWRGERMKKGKSSFLFINRQDPVYPIREGPTLLPITSQSPHLLIPSCQLLEI